MRFAALAVAAAVVFAACGGKIATDVDSGVDGSKDASTEVCKPPHQACTDPCPTGTVCLRTSGPTPGELGCTVMPADCNGVATCDCMKCFCPDTGSDKCSVWGDGSLLCSNGTISKRAFKADIEYVSSEERADLARETLAIPLATYRYKTECQDDKRHLGFIIDDQPVTSPAVAGDQTHVDQYGYTSMLLATVQEQQKQIDALRKEVEALKR